MADAVVGDVNIGFVNKTKAQGGSTTGLGTVSNYASLVALKTRLQTINGAYWTNARIAQHTVNDLVYALRLADDPGTI